MWSMIQCAVQGRGHIKTNVPCQDKTHTMFRNNVYVVALADGAGSAIMSHYGAEYVTKTMCECLTKDFDMYYAENDGVAIKRKVVSDLLVGLQEVAKVHGCEMKELASTMLVAAIKEDKYILMHIGDGVIGYLKNNEIKIASKPENGEFANTTVFVTSRDVLHSMKILKGQLKDIHGFVLMSDGTETSFYDKKNNALAPALNKIMKLSQLIDSECLEKEITKSFENVIKHNTTDDCSIALIVEEDYSFCGYNLMTQSEKEILFEYKKCQANKKRIRRMDMIVNYLIEPHSLSSISQKTYLKKKYVKRYVEVLQEKNLIIYDKGMYQTAIILEKK